MIKRFLFLLIFISPLNAISQKDVDTHSQLWLTAGYKFNVGARSSLTFDGSLRTADFVSRWRQQIVRGVYVRSMNNKLKLGGGFTFSNAYSYQSPPAAAKEYRPFLHSEYSIKKWNFRGRWETRFFENNNDAFNRFRLQVKYSTLVGKTTKLYNTGKYISGEPVVTKKEIVKYSIILANETMYQSKKWDCFGYDQNRAYAGIRFEFEKNYAEAGYSLFYIRKSTQRYELDHVVMMSFYFQ
ncbi:MAG: DUF2490 domain-containing protein [Bacteroidota bacterium]